MQSWSESNRLHSSNVRELATADALLEYNMEEFLDALLVDLEIEDILNEIQTDQERRVRAGLF